MNKKSILVVDDEPDIGIYVSDFYASDILEVRTANDGVVALESIKNRKPDLILLDVKMPRLDGFAVLAKLKSDARYANIPVIMLTCMSTGRDVDRGIMLGADFYLPKPFKFDNLSKFIETILN